MLFLLRNSYFMMQMKQSLVFFLAFLFSKIVFSQAVANFQIRDDSQRIMCYTQYPNGIAVKNNEVEFKNTSTCPGTPRYIYDFGDGSKQIIKDNTLSVTHYFSFDGEYKVSLQVLNIDALHDSIKNKPLLSCKLHNKKTDSVAIELSYTGADNSTTTIIQMLHTNDYSIKELPYSIFVYSPYIDEDNFFYSLDDPSTTTNKAPIQSFAYILHVDTTVFKPHDPKKWQYHWAIFKTNDFGEPESKPITQFATDSLEYKYTFPAENYSPGYYVTLKIVLDSSKFEDIRDIEYYKLEECVYTRSQIIPVTDYFYTESTQRNDNIKQREAAIPNTFTPGGNDENEVFLFNTNGVDIFSVWIYNDWGTLIYNQEALTISWTGRDNLGKNCPSGVYYYVIKSTNKDKRHETSGFIQLFRQD